MFLLRSYPLIKWRKRSVKCTAFLLGKRDEVSYLRCDWYKFALLKRVRRKPFNMQDISVLGRGCYCVTKSYCAWTSEVFCEGTLQQWWWSSLSVYYLTLRINGALTRAGDWPPAFPSQPFNLTAMLLKGTSNYFQGRDGGNTIFFV